MLDTRRRLHLSRALIVWPNPAHFPPHFGQKQARTPPPPSYFFYRFVVVATVAPGSTYFGPPRHRAKFGLFVASRRARRGSRRRAALRRGRPRGQSGWESGRLVAAVPQARAGQLGAGRRLGAGAHNQMRSTHPPRALTREASALYPSPLHAVGAQGPVGAQRRAPSPHAPTHPSGSPAARGPEVS